ncbi:ion transporter [Patescibacteria group bacterium]
MNSIVNSKIFILIAVFIIVLNAVVLGYGTIDNNINSRTLAIFDYVITLFFLFEIFIRAFSVNPYDFFFKSKDKWWNIFDSLVLVISLLPLNNSEFALIIRLVRVLRVITIIPETKRMVGTLIKSFRGMFAISILSFILMYIYGMIGFTLYGEILPNEFGNIINALTTLTHTIFNIETLTNHKEIDNLFIISFFILGGIIFMGLFIVILFENYSAESDNISNNNDLDTQMKEIIEQNKVLIVQNKILLEGVECKHKE